MDASRGFLSGTVDKFKMVKILIFFTSAKLSHGNLFTHTETNPYLVGLRDEIKPQDGYHGGILHCCLHTHLLPHQVGAYPLWHRLISSCMWWCILRDCMTPFSTLNDQSIGSQKKRSVGGLWGDVLLPSHLKCLLLHGWVTLVGGYAAFLYQIVWIFLYMCALAGNSDMGASARDAACRWTPLQCCLIDGANVKCDFCLSWWVNNWILIPESNLNMALAIASSAASSIRVMDAVSLWVHCDGDSTFLHVIM